MAENEIKARKKLEEAEKKTKGASGFLSNLFGGSKNDEAADLFVQVCFKFYFIQRHIELNLNVPFLL